MQAERYRRSSARRAFQLETKRAPRGARFFGWVESGPRPSFTHHSRDGLCRLVDGRHDAGAKRCRADQAQISRAAQFGEQRLASAQHDRMTSVSCRAISRRSNSTLPARICWTCLRPSRKPSSSAQAPARSRTSHRSCRRISPACPPTSRQPSGLPRIRC